MTLFKSLPATFQVTQSTHQGLSRALDRHYVLSWRVACTEECSTPRRLAISLVSVERGTGWWANALAGSFLLTTEPYCSNIFDIRHPWNVGRNGPRLVGGQLLRVCVPGAFWWGTGAHPQLPASGEDDVLRLDGVCWSVTGSTFVAFRFCTLRCFPFVRSPPCLRSFGSLSCNGVSSVRLAPHTH